MIKIIKTVRCDCGATFSSRSSLRSHKSRVCPIINPNRPVYVCSCCFSEYKKKDYYNKHILTCKKEQTVSETKPIISINLTLNCDNKTSNIESEDECNSDTENDEELFDTNEYSPCEQKKNTNIQEVEQESQSKTFDIKDLKNKDNKNGYIYLLQEREFVRLDEPTYKIGRTTQTLANRFSDYPKGSHIIVAFSVEDCFTMESHLISLFDKKFIKKTEYGTEYFYGDVKLMKRIIAKEIFLSYDN